MASALWLVCGLVQRCSAAVGGRCVAVMMWQLARRGGDRTNGDGVAMRPPGRWLAGLRACCTGGAQPRVLCVLRRERFVRSSALTCDADETLACSVVRLHCIADKRHTCGPRTRAGVVSRVTVSVGVATSLKLPSSLESVTSYVTNLSARHHAGKRDAELLNGCGVCVTLRASGLGIKSLSAVLSLRRVASRHVPHSARHVCANMPVVS